jgi:hypothetical protein
VGTCLRHLSGIAQSERSDGQRGKASQGLCIEPWEILLCSFIHSFTQHFLNADLLLV